ncbi:MAG: acyl-CoA dehydrogenase family protein [Candidatus Niyogibacteria bacterium]|nr:acyl-CoA dehydrogenase family protein [Candidatus Niyogibacteria bacterium]
MGIMGMSFPEEYGRIGASTEATACISSKLAEAWPSLQLIWSVNTALVGFPITTFGREDQKRRTLPFLASGEDFGCFAATETEVGSDLSALKMTAEDHNGKFILNGFKNLITNADRARFMIVFARIKGWKEDISKRHAGITAFLIESNEIGFRDIPGIQISSIRKRGFGGAPFCLVEFDNVVISEDSILGEQGKGMSVALATLDIGRLGIASQGDGIARRALTETREYTKTRTVFDMRLIDLDVIGLRLAEHEAYTDVIWKGVLDACRKKDRDMPFSDDAAKVKLLSAENARRVARDCCDMFGGYWYTYDYVIGDIKNDAEILPTYEGTAEIQKSVIIRKHRKL